jgi:phosphoglycolate phosphatase
VTGNLEPIGWSKMDALGLGSYFTSPRFGGFGSDFCSGNTDESWRDRAELVRIASSKGVKAVQRQAARASRWDGAADAEAISGQSAQDQQWLANSYWRERYHVGDTPMDIKAALDAGAVAIGE